MRKKARLIFSWLQPWVAKKMLWKAGRPLNTPMANETMMNAREAVVADRGAALVWYSSSLTIFKNANCSEMNSAQERIVSEL